MPVIWRRSYAAELSETLVIGSLRVATQRAASAPVAGSTAQVMQSFGCGRSSWWGSPVARNALIACTVERLVIAIPHLTMRPQRSR
jgi:hypothetical protein